MTREMAETHKRQAMFRNSLRTRLLSSVSLVPWLVRELLTQAERAAVVRVCDYWVGQIDERGGVAY
jgi:hypothetical protein